MKTTIGFVFLSATLFLANLTEGQLNSSIAQANSGLISTCKKKLIDNSNTPSGEYQMSVNGHTLQVYCEMKLNGGGYTFFNKESIAYINSQSLASWFTDKRFFLMRVLKKNGDQPYAVLKQLTNYASVPLKLGYNEFNMYNEPMNSNILLIGQPYLYYGFLSTSQINIGTINGLRVNDVDVSFSNCDFFQNSYFALYPNLRGLNPSLLSVIFEFCNRIFSNFKPAQSIRKMPAAYFMFGETHWGGCGCYLQSNQQSDILSWSIGFR